MMTVDRIAELLRSSSLEFRQLEETHHRYPSTARTSHFCCQATPHRDWNGAAGVVYADVRLCP